jgi:hypothetical protein
MTIRRIMSMASITKKNNLMKDTKQQKRVMTHSSSRIMARRRNQRYMMSLPKRNIMRLIIKTIMKSQKSLNIKLLSMRKYIRTSHLKRKKFPKKSIMNPKRMQLQNMRLLIMRHMHQNMKRHKSMKMKLSKERRLKRK